MGSRIEHRADYAADVAAVLAASSEQAPLRARLESLGGARAALLEHAGTADGVRFVLRQGIAAEHLPQAVRSIHKGDLLVQREQVWRRDGAGYTGTAKAEVDGVPGEILARTTLTGENGRSLLRTSGEVKVRIPIFGGKLESAIAEQVTKLLEREAEFTAKWLADNG